MSLKTSRLIGALGVSICLLAAPAQAADPGDLDIAFSSDGKTTVPVGLNHDRGFALAVQSDDKLVIAGSRLAGDDDFALVRLSSSGSLDTSFSGDGRTTTDFSSGNDVAFGVAIQTDGRIVSAGLATVGGNFDFALTRHTSAGVLDTSFDTDGRQTTLFGAGDDVAQAVAIQSDGKIVVAGYSWNGVDNDFAVARYNSDGSLDTTFSGDGRQTTDFGADDYGFAVALQSDGKIVVAGSSGTNFALLRYNSNGNLDTSFDSDGRVTTDLGGIDIGYALVLQSDGRILVAGGSEVAGDEDFAIVRYLSNGSLDSSFDGDGVRTIGYSTGRDRAYALALQSDGRILVGGVAIGPADSDFALARLTTAGALDSGFGDAGKVLTHFVTGDDFGRALALQSTGRILLAGYAASLTDDDIAVARYRNVSGPAAVVDGGGGGGGGGGCVLSGTAVNNELHWLLAGLLAAAAVRRTIGRRA